MAGEDAPKLLKKTILISHFTSTSLFLLLYNATHLENSFLFSWRTTVGRSL